MSDKNFGVKESSPEAHAVHNFAPGLAVANQTDGKSFARNGSSSPANESLPSLQIYDSKKEAETHGSSRKPENAETNQGSVPPEPRTLPLLPPDSPEQQLANTIEQHEEQQKKIEHFLQTPWAFHKQEDVHGKTEIIPNRYKPV